MQKHIEPQVSIADQLVSEWDIGRNGIELSAVDPGSKDKFWWHCPEGDDHLWQQSLYLRANAGGGCPFCSNRRVSTTNSLLSMYPNVAEEWAVDLNDGLLPQEIVAYEKKRRWWRCLINHDHVWAAKTVQRTRQGTNCPECSGRGFKLDVNGNRRALSPLSDASKNVLEEFDRVLNFPLTPDDFHFGATRKVWWRCSFDKTHVWQASPGSRTKGNQTGCPHCWKLYAGLLLPHLGGRGVREGTLSIAEANFQMAKEFDVLLNSPLLPEHLAISSNRRVWWRCENAIDHVWDQSPGSRTNSSSGCPFCAGVRVARSTSLAIIRPKLADQWDYVKNGNLTPYDVSPRSSKKVWWVCKVNNHSWHRSPSAMKSDDCPGCRLIQQGSSNKVGDRGLLIDHKAPVVKRYPSIAKWIHPTLNGVEPEELYAFTGDSIWWMCDIDESHVWSSSLLARIGRETCPFCARKRVSNINRIQTASPELYDMLDVNQDPGVNIDELSVGSTREKIWLLCKEDPTHRWQLTPNAAFSNLNRSSSLGCPYCAGKLVNESNSMLVTEPVLSKTFHPTLNKDFRDENNLPIDLSAVTSGSSRFKFWWQCPVAPDHIWQTTPKNRCNSGCPACDGKQISKTNSLATKFPALARQWHTTLNGELEPEGVTSATGLKVWWQCIFDPSHEWFARISDRTKKGAGCPHCQLIPRSRVEIILRHELEANIGGTSSLHKIQLKSGRLDCDIVFEQDRLVVEYDGAYWHRLKYEKDLEKTSQLIDAGWRVLRIREEPLEIVSPLDVLVPVGSSSEQICGAAVLAVSRLLNRNVDRARDYAIAGKLVGITEAEKEIAELLQRKREKRDKTADLD